MSPVCLCLPLAFFSVLVYGTIYVDLWRASATSFFATVAVATTTVLAIAVAFLMWVVRRSRRTYVEVVVPEPVEAPPEVPALPPAEATRPPVRVEGGRWGKIVAVRREASQ
jgi:hypothetical protein